MITITRIDSLVNSVVDEVLGVTEKKNLLRRVARQDITGDNTPIRASLEDAFLITKFRRALAQMGEARHD
jgi:hypothetical protein